MDADSDDLDDFALTISGPRKLNLTNEKQTRYQKATEREQHGRMAC